MNPAHARLRDMGLNDDDFMTVKTTLIETLKEDFSFTESQLDQVAVIVESTREQARVHFELHPQSTRCEGSAIRQCLVVAAGSSLTARVPPRLPRADPGPRSVISGTAVDPKG